MNKRLKRLTFIFGGAILVFTVGTALSSVLLQLKRYNNESSQPVSIHSPYSVHSESMRARIAVCNSLYNIDRHQEWAECMGVGYK